MRFSTTAAGTEEKCLQQTQSGSKSVNLFTAINQALHVALETDPR